MPAGHELGALAIHYFASSNVTAAYSGFRVSAGDLSLPLMLFTKPFSQGVAGCDERRVRVLVAKPVHDCPAVSAAPLPERMWGSLPDGRMSRLVKSIAHVSSAKAREGLAGCHELGCHRVVLHR